MRRLLRSHLPADVHTPAGAPKPRAEPPKHRASEVPERAVLVAVLVPNTKADLNDPLAELAALAESAGVEVVDAMVQKRTNLSPGYALGRGKLVELAERAEAAEADLIIFDNELTPRQIRGLEERVKLKVLDRSELILDIFSVRARTREAQLQVELAQLQYTAPRIRGMWTHLERIAGAGRATGAGAVGGVGTRGPGERQIELDRRIAKDRIAHLKRQLRELDERKRREVRSRHDQFKVSLVGYTNSGKSTLMNRLTGTNRLAVDMLFATLDTKTARWDLGDGCTALLSDTVGFVRDIPHGLVASFRATLEEAIHADLLLHIVDVSAATAWQQIEAVDGVLADIGCGAIPQITVLNKVDIADDTSLCEMLAYRKTAILPVSALSGAGIEKLVSDVLEHFHGETVSVTVLVPHAEGKLLAELTHLGEVRDRRYVGGGVELDLRMSREPFHQLCGRYPTMSVVAGDIDPPDGEEPGADVGDLS